MSHVQDITTIKHLVLQTYHKRSLSFWKYIYIYIYFLVTEFQNCGSEHDHGLLWIKNAPMYGMHINEKIESL